jgi:regulator of sigma E protease
VGVVAPGTPAYDALLPDDHFKEIDGKPIVSWADLKAAVEPAVNRTLSVTVSRKGKPETFSIAPVYGSTGKGVIGISQKTTQLFAHVEPDSYFGKAGLRSGDILYTNAEGKRTEDPIQAAGIVRVRKTDDKPVTFEVLRGAKERTPVKITLAPEMREEGDLAALGFLTTAQGQLVTGPSRPYRRRAGGDAIAAGLYEPVDVAIMTFEILKELVTGGESPKGLSGPLGIIHASYTFAELSFGNFLWLLCLITVNLGVFNLLPIPILDGGHNLLLLIEVIRKKFGKPPPSETFVAAFQWTGLIFVLALFVFVTFNDVLRFSGRG